jgi:hypothetical protein
LRSPQRRQCFTAKRFIAAQKVSCRVFAFATLRSQIDAVCVALLMGRFIGALRSSSFGACCGRSDSTLAIKPWPRRAPSTRRFFALLANVYLPNVMSAAQPVR